MRGPRSFVAAFLMLFLLAEPPAVYLIGTRIEPTILSMPFLYVYLGVLYAGMIGILVQAGVLDDR
jgi:hypothetical protein